MALAARAQYTTNRHGQSDAIEAPRPAANWFPYLAVVAAAGLLLFESRDYWDEPLGTLQTLDVSETRRIA